MKTNSTHENFDRNRPDWDWFAFCYIADELPPSELVWFESLLAEQTDSGDAARQAVADAVERGRLIHAATELGPIQSSTKLQRSRRSESPENRLGDRSGKSWKPRLVFAASVMLALCSGWWAIQASSTNSLAEIDSEESLATAWVDALDVVAEVFVSEDDVQIAEAETIVMPTQLNQDDDEDELLNDSQWMFAALLESDEESSDLNGGL